MHWESSIHLADGVGLGLTLAIEMAGIASIVATVSDSTIASDTSIAIVYSCYDSVAIAMVHLADGVGISIGIALAIEMATIASMGDIGGEANIVGVSSGIGIMDWESSIHLADGVGLGLTLAIEMAGISSIVATVSDSTIASDTSIAIVYSCYDSVAIAMVHL